MLLVYILSFCFLFFVGYFLTAFGQLAYQFTHPARNESQPTKKKVRTEKKRIAINLGNFL